MKRMKILNILYVFKNYLMDRRSTQIFLQEDIQMTKKNMKKMLSIANYQKNANQNFFEVLPHTAQNDQHQKVYKQYMLDKM